MFVLFSCLASRMPIMMKSLIYAIHGPMLLPLSNGKISVKRAELKMNVFSCSGSVSGDAPSPAEDWGRVGLKRSFGTPRCWLALLSPIHYRYISLLHR